MLWFIFSIDVIFICSTFTPTRNVLYNIVVLNHTPQLIVILSPGREMSTKISFLVLLTYSSNMTNISGAIYTVEYLRILIILHSLESRIHQGVQVHALGFVIWTQCYQHLPVERLTYFLKYCTLLYFLLQNIITQKNVLIALKPRVEIHNVDYRYKKKKRREQLGSIKI